MRLIRHLLVIVFLMFFCVTVMSDELPLTVEDQYAKNARYDQCINAKIKSVGIAPLSEKRALCDMKMLYSAFSNDLPDRSIFCYEQSVVLNMSDSARVIRSSFLNFLYNYFTRAYPVHKGEIYLYGSCPYINSFNFKPVNEGAKINTGFWGIALGLEYGYATNRFLSLGVSGVLDFFLPVPAAVDLIGEHEFMSSGYISLSNNYKISRFTIGYGVSCARNTWTLKYYDRFDPLPPTREPVKKRHSAFGLVFPVYVQVWKQVHAGVVYRPTFFTPDLKEKFTYEHIISIAFTYKIRVKS